MSIAAAVKQVAEELVEGVAPERAVAHAAEDYALNPVLVARKFTEQHGTAPAAYMDEMAARAERAANASKCEAAKRAADQQTAREVRAAMAEFFATPAHLRRTLR